MNKTEELIRVSEYNCRCNCGKNNVKHSHLEAIRTARIMSDVVYKINSGCRCVTHNKKEGGSPTSSHLDGWATDIEAKTYSMRFKILKGLIMAGFTRIGIYPTFIHADNDPVKVAEVAWLPRRKKKGR